MVRRCYVPDCSSEEGKEEHQGVTFHKIPMHSDIRPKWMLLCRIPEDKKDMKVIYICSRHFLNADFCHFKGKKYMLKQGVLPSVFPWKKAIPKKTKLQKGNCLSPPSANSDDNLLKTVVNDNKEEEISIKREPTLSATDNLSPSMSSMLSSSTAYQSEKQQEKIKAFTPNMHIEALDFNEVWYPAQIVEVDYEESEVLIHFEKYSSKYDEWISMNSSRLRPLQKKETQKFSVGEKCLASWSDARKFPATVTKVLNNGVYEVKFDDGFVKSLKVHRMVKVDGKHLQSSPLFDPIQSTKQERRDRKRKLNVAALFGKRSKPFDTSTSDESAPQIEDVADIWVPKWENGKPVGEESSIELNDGARKSVIVVDPRLPPNWVKHLAQRPHGTSAGKWDTVIVNPEGKRFRTRSEVKTWLEAHPDYNLTAYTFDFSLHKKTRRSAQIRETVSNQTTVENGVSASEEHDPEVVQQNEVKNNLKITSVDGVYQCPISGCDKSFRRENLAQMHVKHYHPEYTKYLDSTPNVADLAYARTVGENLTEKAEKLKQIPLKSQGSKNIPSKTTGSAPTQSTKNDSDPPSIFPCDDDNEDKMKIKEEALSVLKDSEILKLLNTKPSVGSVAIKYPPGLPPNAYPDIKLKDLLKKSDAVPGNVNDSNSASSSSSSSLSYTNANRSSGIKTLLPIVKCEIFKKEGDNSHENSQTEAFEEGESHFPESLPAADYKEQCSEDTMPSVLPCEPNYIVEGGEVIKIVQMRREEIINCTCGITEEDGLMIQCELCLCWQHAYCNNIEKENQVPDKYVCYICQNSTRSRSSRIYYHDQDWLKHGVLTVGSYHCKDDDMLFKRFEKLNKSHDYSGALIELKSYIHALRIKLNIAEAKNHPKLYLWSKPWLKCLLSEEINKKEEIRNLSGHDERSIDDLYHIQKNKNNETISPSFENLANSSVLLSLLKSHKTEEPLTTDNLLDLDTVKIPQPEAAIDSSECRLNLLDHINFGQNLVEARLDVLEKKMQYFDVVGDNEEDDHVHICRTIKMLLRDLLLLQDFGQSSSL
ncbi:PHD finger protein 20 [Agrilus planipennis]|uniref:PHD finger protein 20 n=1 Tax=Agrilus planipennis TaxID=224129 RepID=A0A1W4XJU7_AGRPL|nr:PHD finger protein 20 [Agrilus planipennis]